MEQQITLSPAELAALVGNKTEPTPQITQASKDGWRRRHDIEAERTSK